jgi:acyl carrier protein
MNPQEEKIINFISLHLGVEEKEIQPNSHFFDDLNVDKIALADLYLAVQKEFGIKLPPQDLEQVQTIADLIKLIEEGSDEFL